MEKTTERAEPASERIPIVEPAAGGTPAVMKGEWITRQGRVAEFAILETRTGSAVMIDARATRIACLVHGIVIERPRGAVVETELRAALRRFVDLADAEYLGTDPRAAHAVKMARAALGPR